MVRLRIKGIKNPYPNPNHKNNPYRNPNPKPNHKIRVILILTVRKK